MMLRFVVSNFLSFNEELEMNLFPYTRLREQRDHIYQTPEVELLKVAAIYGANGAGKSNLVKAMQFLRDIATDGSSPNPQVTGAPFFLEKSSQLKPSTFELEFFSGSKYYAYGIELLEGVISNEYLYETYPKKGDQRLVFNRYTKGGRVTLELAEEYLQSTEDRVKVDIYLKRFASPSRPLLPLLAEDESYLDITMAHHWLLKSLNFVYPSHRIMSFGQLLRDFPAFANFAGQVLPKLDTGIEEIGLDRSSYDAFFGIDDPEAKEAIVNQLRSGKKYVQVLHRNVEPIMIEEENGELKVSRVMFLHRGKDGVNEWFELLSESEGTQRILDLMAPLFSAIYLGNTVVIDEIGRSLHPELLAALLSLYMRSPTKGQLIFTTHEEFVLNLDLFRRDEIWFIDKKLSGASSITRLHEFKVRSDLDVHKGYINGRFGGTPRVGSLNRMQLSRG